MTALIAGIKASNLAGKDISQQLDDWDIESGDEEEEQNCVHNY